MRRPRSSAFVVAATLAIAPLAPSTTDAQQKSGVVTESAGVTLIEIPVNVVGKDGHPVQALKASDFELFDENKKVELAGFEVIDISRSAPANGAAKDPFSELPPPAARRHWLLVFDLSYSTPTGLLRARAGAHDFLQKQLAPQDLASVATLSTQNGWKLLVNFTADRKQLEQAVDTLGLIKTGVRTTDPLAFAFVQPSAGAGASGAKGVADEAVREQIEDFQRLQQAASDERERGRANQLLNSLGMMGRVLDSVRGRKHVLFFSEGFESRLLTGNAGQFATPLEESSSSTQDNAAEASLHGETWKINSDSRFGSSASQNRLVNALASYKRSDTTLNTIDISGLHADGELGRKVGAGADALFSIASETNGEFIRNANQLGTELGKIAERTAITYLLVYQPSGLKKPGTFHNLKIKVNAPGARVMARSGYYEPRPFRALTPLERVLASGDLVVGGQRSEEVPVRVIAAPFPAETGVAQVPVVIEIGGSQLVAGDPGPKTGVEIYAYAIDKNGSLADYATQELSLELAKVRSMLEGGGIKYYATLFVP
ncbi:MAG: VWA domain-containing protein, partial [Acidobacteriota bacterium]